MAKGELILTHSQWTKKINERWRQAAGDMICAVFELGGWLWQAKDDLEHGEFQTMIQGKLEFSYNTANAFMRIREWVDKRGLKIEQVQRLLPPDWGTIRKITRLDDETYERLVEEGVICPTLERNEVAKILRLKRLEADEKRILDLVPTAGKFRTLVVDPAWEYDWLSLAGRAKPGYAMQTLEQLRNLDVMQWAEPECHLYCWTTNNFMAEACKLVAHWGFQHRVVLTGIKKHFGLGSYFRNASEHVLFATLGNTTTRPAASRIATWFVWESGLEHSEKPEAFYDIVRAASYPPYGEMNQRKTRADFVNLHIARAEAVA